MDRRAFIKSFLASGALVAINPELAVEQILKETSDLNDIDFATYIYFTMKIHVDNPAHCMIITNIGED
jgi:hypothetical protein